MLRPGKRLVIRARWQRSGSAHLDPRRVERASPARTCSTSSFWRRSTWRAAPPPRRRGRPRPRCPFPPGSSSLRFASRSRYRRGRRGQVRPGRHHNIWGMPPPSRGTWPRAASGGRPLGPSGPKRKDSNVSSVPHAVDRLARSERPTGRSVLAWSLFGVKRRPRRRLVRAQRRPGDLATAGRELAIPAAIGTLAMAFIGALTREPAIRSGGSTWRSPRASGSRSWRPTCPTTASPGAPDTPISRTGSPSGRSS